MTVENVIARMYDAGVSKTAYSAEVESSEGSEVFQKAVEEKVADCNCSDADAKTVSSVIEAEDKVVEKSAMYRFTAYVRISSDFSSLGATLLDEFKDATRAFVSALKDSRTNGVPVLDQYLNKAEESAAGGALSGKSFIDSILAAADNGLKAITASMTGSAWMSGLNMGSSTGMTSASPADIARIHLQNSLGNFSTGNASTKVARADYGNGRTLELVNSRSASLEKVDSSSDGGSKAVKIDDTVLNQRDKLLDRFLQLIDRMDSAFSGLSIIRAGFSIAYEKIPDESGKDAGKAVGMTAKDDSVSDKSSGDAVPVNSEGEGVSI